MNKTICLNGLDNNKVMRPSELVGLRGGSGTCTIICQTYGGTVVKKYTVSSCPLENECDEGLYMNCNC